MNSVYIETVFLFFILIVMCCVKSES